MNENDNQSKNQNRNQSPASDSVDPNALTRPLPEHDRAAAAAPRPQENFQGQPQESPEGGQQKPSREKPWGRKRGLLIGAAAVVALLAVGGSAYAIGANVADEDEDRPAAAGEQSGPAGEDADDDELTRPNDLPGERRSDSDGQGGGAENLPPTDADALREAAEQAIAEVGAEGATSIDVERGGYEIETQLADGSEPDVFVAADGTVTTGTDRDDDDDRPEPLLDLGKLEDISKAAVAEAAKAGGADGTIDSISTADENGVAYEVSVRLPDGRDAEIELAGDLGVLVSDVDDD